MHPVAEGPRLTAYLNVNPDIVSQYNVNVAQVVTDFAALPAVPPLAFNPALLASFLSHSQDLAAHGGNGSGGRTAAVKVTRFATQYARTARTWSGRWCPAAP